MVFILFLEWVRTSSLITLYYLWNLLQRMYRRKRLQPKISDLFRSDSLQNDQSKLMMQLMFHIQCNYVISAPLIMRDLIHQSAESLDPPVADCLLWLSSKEISVHMWHAQDIECFKALDNWRDVFLYNQFLLKYIVLIVCKHIAIKHVLPIN